VVEIDLGSVGAPARVRCLGQARRLPDAGPGSSDARAVRCWVYLR